MLYSDVNIPKVACVISTRDHNALTYILTAVCSQTCPLSCLLVYDNSEVHTDIRYDPSYRYILKMLTDKLNRQWCVIYADGKLKTPQKVISDLKHFGFEPEWVWRLDDKSNPPLPNFLEHALQYYSAFGWVYPAPQTTNLFLTSAYPTEKEPAVKFEMMLGV
jgi:hypothetical protein